MTDPTSVSQVAHEDEASSFGVRSVLAVAKVLHQVVEVDLAGDLGNDFGGVVEKEADAKPFGQFRE